MAMEARKIPPKRNYPVGKAKKMLGAALVVETVERPRATTRRKLIVLLTSSPRTKKKIGNIPNENDRNYFHLSQRFVLFRRRSILVPSRNIGLRHRKCIGCGKW
jgi:hypothetical protein